MAGIAQVKAADGDWSVLGGAHTAVLPAGGNDGFWHRVRRGTHSAYTEATGIEVMNKAPSPGVPTRCCCFFYNQTLLLVVFGRGIVVEWLVFFKHGIFKRDYCVCAPLASEEFNQNQQVFSIPLFRRLLAAIQRPYNAMGKIETVQGLREEQG